MRVRTIAAALVLCAGTWVSKLPAQPTVSSNFDAGIDGWSAVGFQINIFPPSATRVANAADMAHSATDGNPGGYARLTDAVTDPGSFASAPSKFLGNLSAYKNVGKISFDHRLFATGTPNSGIQSYGAFIISGNPNNFNFLYWQQSPGPSGPTNWVHFDVPINTAAWSVSPFATMSFDQILSNVTEILLPFELVDNDGTQNQEHGGLDNVVLGAAAVVGDYNKNNKVDAADYTIWRDSFGQSGSNLPADGNGSNQIDNGDYTVWKQHFGEPAGGGGLASTEIRVPEPASLVLFIVGMLSATLRSRVRLRR